MPVASSLRELIDALQTRRTNTTRLLDELFGSVAALERINAHPNRAELDSENVFVSGPVGKLPTWAHDELTGEGSLPVTRTLKPVEVRHINEWPADNKEVFRRVLIDSLNVTPRRPLEFFWELYDGDNETIDTSVPGQVVFRSPKSRAIQSDGNVEVRVGP